MSTKEAMHLLKSSNPKDVKKLKKIEKRGAKLAEKIIKKNKRSNLDFTKPMPGLTREEVRGYTSQDNDTTKSRKVDMKASNRAAEIALDLISDIPSETLPSSPNDKGKMPRLYS